MRKSIAILLVLILAVSSMVAVGQTERCMVSGNPETSTIAMNAITGTAVTIIGATISAIATGGLSTLLVTGTSVAATWLIQDITIHMGTSFTGNVDVSFDSPLCSAGAVMFVSANLDLSGTGTLETIPPVSSTFSRYVPVVINLPDLPNETEHQDGLVRGQQGLEEGKDLEASEKTGKSKVFALWEFSTVDVSLSCTSPQGAVTIPTSGDASIKITSSNCQVEPPSCSPIANCAPILETHPDSVLVPLGSQVSFVVSAYDMDFEAEHADEELSYSVQGFGRAEEPGVEIEIQEHSGGRSATITLSVDVSRTDLLGIISSLRVFVYDRDGEYDDSPSIPIEFTSLRPPQAHGGSLGTYTTAEFQAEFGSKIDVPMRATYAAPSDQYELHFASGAPIYEGHGFSSWQPYSYLTAAVRFLPSVGCLAPEDYAFGGYAFGGNIPPVDSSQIDQLIRDYAIQAGQCASGSCSAEVTWHKQQVGGAKLPLPPGIYTFPFAAFVVDTETDDILSSSLADYTLTIINTLPIAQDDAFTMRTNASGASQSMTCDVLVNDSDPDGVGIVAIDIVKGPDHGTAKVKTVDEELMIEYTSNEGHGGKDTFTYRVSDVPGASTENDADWSNVATVTVTTSTPPVALDTTVRGHPDVWNPLPPETPTSWTLNLQNLSLRATDLDACDNASEYRFLMENIARGRANGNVKIDDVSVNVSEAVWGSTAGEQATGTIVTMTSLTTIKGPASEFIFGRKFTFSFTVVDPDGRESEPSTLNVVLTNEAPLADAIQSRYISFCFGEPMIYPLEPSWYEAGCLSFTDPDGDPLTFRISQQPRKGRADLMKSGGGGEYEVTVMYHIDHDDAMLDHTDDVPFVDYLTVEAKDPFGATAETVLEITVDVINSDPVCGDDEVTTPMNTAIEFDVLGNDSDIDGDELSVIAVDVAGNGVASSVAHNMIRYEPLARFYGDDTFKYTAEDGYGGLDEATVTVHVVDTEPPVFVRGPGDVGPLSNVAGTCGAAGKWTAPISGVDVTDNIGLASVTCTHTSGDVFPVGVTTVTYTATDLSGNTTDHAFTVTVVDDELPTIDGMPSDICVEVPVGVTETTVSWIEPTARDNCGIDSLVGTHTPGAVFPLGVTSVVYTATDIHGNVVTDSLGVTVAEAWQLACSNKYVATSNPSGTTVTFADPVIGGCGVTTTFDPVSGSFFDVGDTDVTCEVTDGVRTETCTFTVTVEFVNHDPVANGDVVDLKDSEIATEIDVLKNDSDADGDDLTIVSVSSSSPCGEVWIDPDGESVWFIGMYCQPYLGGTATFTYTISDGNGGEDTCTVSVDLPDSGTMPEVAEPPKDDR